MDNRDNKASDREEDQRRVDLLADRYEFYRMIAMIFFDKLDHKDKIDALLQVIEALKADRGGEW